MKAHIVRNASFLAVQSQVEVVSNNERRRIARMMILTFYIHHHLQKSVGSGRCHHWRRSLPSLAAAAANHVPA
ncbi:MAG: hypothetical protein IJ892_14085, partial [Prevotella sp.]|nr:hypothetical protein [Prevotella sp.]